MLGAEHLLCFRGIDFRLQHVDGACEVDGDVFAALRPVEQHTEVVDFLREAGNELEVFGEPALTLQGFLCLRLLVPEVGSGDLLFELG